MSARISYLSGSFPRGRAPFFCARAGLFVSAALVAGLAVSDAAAETVCASSTTYVAQAGGAGMFMTIQAAVNALPNSVVGQSCVMIEDSSTYGEQVTVANFAMNGGSITIAADVGMAPAVDPTGETAAFMITNASVNVLGINIAPSGAASYGVFISSAYVQISSVNVQDAGGEITTAGIGIVASSWATVSYTSVTVGGTTALGALGASSVTVTDSYLSGGSDSVDIAAVSGYDANFFTIAQSTLVASNNALYTYGASSVTVTGSFLSGGVYSVDIYAYQGNDANLFTIAQSTLVGGSSALYTYGASSVTVTGSYISGGTDGADIYADLGGDAYFFIIAQSTLTAPNGNALYTYGASSVMVMGSYLSGGGGDGADIEADSNGYDANFFIIAQSILVGSNKALYTYGASSVTVIESFLLAENGIGADIEANYGNDANFFTITQSTVDASNASGFLIEGASSMTITGSYILGKSLGIGIGTLYGNDANYFTIAQSTLVASNYGLATFSVSSMTVTGSFILGGIDAIEIIPNFPTYNLPNFFIIAQSTLIASHGAALYAYEASSVTLLNSYIQGSTGVYVSGSTGTMIGGSVLVATNTAGSALQLDLAASGLILSSSVLTAGSAGAAVYLSAGDTGLIVLSTNTLSGAKYGVLAASPTVTARIWITSNTIVPAITGANKTYGLYFNGLLLSGATIENNTVAYRTSGTMGTNTSYALYAQSSSGLLIDHNRFDDPGMITVGSFYGAYFSNVTHTSFDFNDLNSTGPALTNAFLLRAGETSSNMTVQNNVFLSSFPTPGTSSGTLAVTDAGSETGFAANYNDYYSSSSVPGFQWGGAGVQGLPAWQGAPSSQDGASISENPLWFDPGAGAEDFHPLSLTGRWNPATQAFALDAIQSPTIDAGTGAFSLEPSPNGNAANLGSYGDTAQASESSSTAAGYSNYVGCSSTTRVGTTPTGASWGYATISAALSALSPLAAGKSCVVIEDGATYPEQVTVQNFAMSGSSIAIFADPGSGLMPTVSPPAGSTAAFVIANASVSVAGIDIVPTNAMTYGVLVSSPYVRIGGVNVLDALGNISAAGIALSSWTTVSYTSVTVGGTSVSGFWLPGSTMTSVSNSSASVSNSTGYALWLEGSYSNTVAQSYLANSEGAVIYAYGASSVTVTGSFLLGQIECFNIYANVGNDANDFTIAQSTLIGTAYALVADGASSVTVTGSYLSGAGAGSFLYAYLGNDANFFTIAQSTLVSASAAALNTYGVSSVTVTGSLLAGGVLIESDFGYDANSFTIAQSTLSSSSSWALATFGASSLTVTGSYLTGSYGSDFVEKYANDADFFTIAQSTLVGSGGYNALYLHGVSYVTVTGSELLGTAGVEFFSLLGNDANFLTIAQSSLIASAGPALYAQGASSVTVTGSSLSGTYVAQIEPSSGDDANFFTIAQSTLVGTSDPALYAYGASYVTVAGSYLTGVGDGADLFADIGDDAHFFTIAQSTVVGSNNALSALGASSITVLGSYIQGSTAVYVSGSTGTAIGGSVLAAVNAAGSALQLDQGSANLTLSGSVLTAGPAGAAVYLDVGSGGLIVLSSNTLSGAMYGVLVATQTGAQVWVTSNTIVPAVTSANNTYGLYLNGLMSGATIENNTVAYRTSDTMGTNTSYALYAQGSAGLLIDHNRFDEPGMIAGGSFVAVGFTGSTHLSFKFNDVNATGTGLANAYLMQLAASTASIRDNVFLSSFVVSGSSASLSLDAGSDFYGNYNDWFSSNTAKQLVWGGNAYSFPWSAAIHKDTDSISANPQWFNTAAGVEDFHPLSAAGRYNPNTGMFAADAADSPTTDAADPAVAFSLEPSPNGGRANQGSYGGTSQASESSVNTICPVAKTVCASSCDQTTINGALNALPSTLTNNSCVVIKDAGPYNEQVNVTGFTTDGWTLEILADPSQPNLRPVVNPPGSSMAAFVISNPHVSLIGIDIAPSAAVSYGVLVSSAYVTISSVNVKDAGGWISNAGISLSTTTSISYSSVTVVNADGFLLVGAFSAITNSSAAINGASFYALHLNGSSYDTVTQSVFANPSGYGAGLTNNAGNNAITQAFISSGAYVSGSANTISFSTITSNSSGRSGLFVSAGLGDSFWNDYVSGSTAVYIAGSTNTAIGGSVLASTNTTGSALQMDQGSSGLTLSSSVLTAGSAGAAVYLGAGDAGLIVLSTNTLSGAMYGVFAAAPAATAQIWVTSNTIVPAATAANSTYGLYLNGLTSGAMIENNTVAYRTSVAMGTNASYALYAQGSTGLQIDHNRFDDPGMVTGGSFYGAYFSNTPNAAFKFNDVYSSGPALANAVLLRAGESSSNMIVKDNIFFSSFPSPGTSSGTLVVADANTQGSFTADYNDYYSSNAALGFQWGASGAQGLAAWQTASAGDANSRAANPLWFNPSAGVEDFHPLSATGRCPVAGAYGTACPQAYVADAATSLTIDAADPAENETGPNGLGTEPAPNGGLPNQGSTGQTGVASKTFAPACPWINPTSCGFVVNVEQQPVPAGCAAYAKISWGVTASTTPLATNAINTNSCVIIRDTDTYNEQVTVQNFAFAYSSDTLAIMADPSFVSTAPVVNPPSGTAAFVIANASVSVKGINIVPTNTITYGVLISSIDVQLSNVNVQDAGGRIGTAGIALSSWTSISYTSVTVGGTGATGFWLPGSTMTSVSHSSAAANSVAGYAVWLNVASSNTIELSYASNPLGTGVYVDTNSNSNVISQSTMTSNAAGARAALLLNGASSNTISLDYIDNPSGYGAYLETNSNYNTISLSTMATNAGSILDALLILGASYNTVSQSYMTAANIAAYLGGSASYNTISQSTMTGKSTNNYALYLASAYTNTITKSYIASPSGGGAGLSASYSNTISQCTMMGGAANLGSLSLYLADGNTITQSYMISEAYLTLDSNNNTISQSTVTSSVAGSPAVFFQQSSSNTLSGDYIQGSTAVYVSQNSSGNVIGGSVLVATNTAGSALQMDQGSYNLTLSSSSLTAPSAGVGVYLAVGNYGALAFASDTITGAEYGMLIATQAAGAGVSIASMTFANLSAGATAMQFTGGTFNSTFTAVSFDASVGANVNAAALSPGSSITMAASTGTRAGPNYDDDPNHYVHWLGGYSYPGCAASYKVGGGQAYANITAALVGSN